MAQNVKPIAGDAPPNPGKVAVINDALPKRPSEWIRARRSLVKARWPVLALGILSLLVILALFGPQLAPKDPNRQSLADRLKPPFYVNEEGQFIVNTEFPMGTDALGRDVYSRVIYGARISLSVGLAAMLIGGLIGSMAGLTAGFFGGASDNLIMGLADIQLAFPFILLTIMILVVLGPGVGNLIVVLGISQWVTYARISRGQAISQREKEYVEASRGMGSHNRRIMFRAILPNILAPLIVIASFNVASVILAEASLSFLGLGVPPTVPTWGGILAESRDQLLGGSWWLAVYPGVAIMLTVLSLNILGDWLRDFLDPRLRGR
ncbi:MAG TPA: ABC transporter permease [Candidatus Limnocylindrales bacterium]|nr:ABC transporter permease [Candidatus Limnocylindrales bacterium]